MKLFLDEKKRYINLLLVILPLVLLAGFFVFQVYRTATNIVEPDPIDTRNYLEEQEYQLRDNATDLQKELFEELKEDLKADPIDDIKLAGDVVKNYVADFYTWTNKAGQYDVGGMSFVGTYRRHSVYAGAREYFYRYLTEYIEEYGAENLLEVESIEILDAGKYKDKIYISELEGEYDSYWVDCQWTYKDSSKFNTNQFETKLSFTVVKVNKRYEVIEVFEYKEFG